MQLEGNQLKWNANGTLLSYLYGEETVNVMKEMHEGLEETILVDAHWPKKIKNQVYFSPTRLHDCEKFAGRCDKCQQHGPKARIAARSRRRSTIKLSCEAMLKHSLVRST